MTGKAEQEAINVAITAVVTELVRCIFGLIFGNKNKKAGIIDKLGKGDITRWKY